MIQPHHTGALRRDAGVSLVELLVGVLIGLIATAVIYQTFAVSEAFKRNTTGAGDAQQIGLLSTFMVAQDISNAGNALASAGSFLETCPAAPANQDPAEFMKSTGRPVPILIMAREKAEEPDEFIVNYAVPRTIVYPAVFANTAAAGAMTYEVQSPLGFSVGDLIVAIGNNNCDRNVVTAITAPDANGRVTLTLKTPSPHAYAAGDAKVGLFNLGASPEAAVPGQPHAQRLHYAVCFPKGGGCVGRGELADNDRGLVNGALRSKDLLDNGTFQPIASNIVNMKLQYGIDREDGSGDLQWVSPIAGSGWTPQDVMNANWRTISRIKAVRIGLVVSSSQYDREIKGESEWFLFDKSLSAKIKADDGGGGFRYRVYETVVPLRNSLWNRL